MITKKKYYTTKEERFKQLFHFLYTGEYQVVINESTTHFGIYGLKKGNKQYGHKNWLFSLNKITRHVHTSLIIWQHFKKEYRMTSAEIRTFMEKMYKECLNIEVKCITPLD